MAKKYLSLEGLSEYDALLKTKIDDGDEAAKEYADAIKNELLNGAGEAYDTLKELGDLIDENADALQALETVANSKANADHNHDDVYETKTDAAAKLTESQTYTDTQVGNLSEGFSNIILEMYGGSIPEDGNVTIRGIANDEANTALDSAKSYTDSAVSGLASTSSVETSISTHNTATDAHNDIRVLITDLTTKLNNFLDVDDTTTDQLSEVLTLIENNKGTLESLTSSKVNVSDVVNNLTTNVADKPLSAAQGVAIKALIDALEDALETALADHDANTTKHITSAERTNWNAAKTHADSAHAPSNAEKNQNAFSNIKVGDVTVAADTVTDTVTFVGSNVTITPDATNDRIAFSVANGSTSAKGIVQLENSTSSTSTTTAATPNSVKSAYDLANTAKTNAETAQDRANNAYTLAESKVDSLSDLGITATAAELNYVEAVTSNIQTQLNDRIPFDNANAVSLKTGDDLNNFTTPGIYISGSSGVASGLTNSPTTSSGFKLFVIDGYISGRVSQFVTTNNNNLFYRHFNGTSWDDWDTLATKTGLDNKETKGTAATLINRTTAVNAADTNYATYMARGTSLNSAETNPTVNGTIAWTYE